jgi:hypothetical protein
MPLAEASGYGSYNNIPSADDAVTFASASGSNFQGNNPKVEELVSVFLPASGWNFQGDNKFAEDTIFLTNFDDNGGIIPSESPTIRTLGMSVSATPKKSPGFNMIGPKGSYKGRVPVQIEIYGTEPSDFLYKNLRRGFGYVDSSKSDNTSIVGPSGALRTMWWDAIDDIYSVENSKLILNREQGGIQRESDFFEIDPDIPRTIVPYLDMNDSFVSPASGVPMQFDYAVVNTGLHPVRESLVSTSQYYEDTERYEIVTFSEQNNLEIFKGRLTLKNNGTLYEPNFEISGTFNETYDLGQDKEVKSIEWIGGSPNSTSVSFRVRGATESSGYNSLPSQEWKSDIKELHRCRFLELEITLSTSNSTNQYEEVSVISSYLSNSGLVSFNAAQLVDGNTATTGFHTDSAGIGSWMQIDFGAGNEQSLSKWEYYVNVPGNCIWDIEYSDDGASWAKAYIGWDVTGLSNWQEVTWEPVGKYRYWRSYKTSTASGGGWHWELKVNSLSTPGVAPHIKEVYVKTRTEQYDYALPSGWQTLQPNSKVYENYNDWYYTTGPSGVFTDIIDAGRTVDWGKFYLLGTPPETLEIFLYNSLLDNQTPNGTFGGNYEYGVAFQASEDGDVTAIRYYKNASESGTHTGRLWDSGGSLLTSVVFAGETSSGWQEQELLTPYSISANTTYIVSVNANNQGDRVNSLGAVTKGNLSTAPSNFYRWASGGGNFPSSTTSNCYLRDIVFRTVEEQSGEGEGSIKFRAAESIASLETKDWFAPPSGSCDIFPSPSGNRYLQWISPSGSQMDFLGITFYNDKIWLPWEQPYASGVFTGGAYEENSLVKLGLISQTTINSSMLSQFDLNSFNAAQLVDANIATTGFHTDTADPGAWMQIDFGLGNEKSLIKWRYYVLATAQAVWDIQYSDDGTTWTTVYENFDVRTSAGWHEAVWEYVGAHRYWRSYKTNSAVGGAWHYELEVFEQSATSGSYSDILDFEEDKQFAYIAADTREPGDTSVTIEYRTATQTEGQGALSAKSWNQYDSQTALIGASGRYLELKSSLENPSDISTFPEMRNVIIGWLPNMDVYNFQYPEASGQVFPSGYQGQLKLGIKGRTDLESRRSGELEISTDFVIVDSNIQVTDVAPIFQWENVNDPDIPREEIYYEFQVATDDTISEFGQSSVHEIDLSVYDSKSPEVTANSGEVFVSPSGAAFSSSIKYRIDAGEQRIWKNFYSRDDLSLGILGIQIFYKVRFSEDDISWTDWNKVYPGQNILQKGRYAEVLAEFEYFSGFLKYPIREISLTSTPGERAFIVPEGIGSTTSFDYLDVGTLPNDVHNYYRVRAFDGSYFTNWSKVFATFPSIAGAPLAPSGLLAEGLVAPNRLVTFNPYLSWTFEDYAQEDGQAHARIQVGTNPGTYDTWDSGKFPTASGVDYGAANADTRVGPIPLVRGRTYHWRVRAWDDSVGNLGGPFSTESTFQMNQLPTRPLTLNPEDC